MKKNKTDILLEQNSKQATATMDTSQEKAICSKKEKEKKKNYFFMFEELKFQPYLIKHICLYAWFYFFENMRLQLDCFVTSYLNYAFFLLTHVDKDKRKILLIDYPFSLHNEPVDIDEKFSFVLNNAFYENIEKIVQSKSEIQRKWKTETEKKDCDEVISDTEKENEQLCKEMNDEQLNIINFLQKKKIKNMLYMSDIFATDQMSILFLLDSEEEQETESEEENLFDKKQDTGNVGKENIGKNQEKDIAKHAVDSNNNNNNNSMCNGNQKECYSIRKTTERTTYPNDRERDENGIYKGYDVIIIRSSYEILYFYKALDNGKIVHKGSSKNSKDLNGCYKKYDSDEEYMERKNTEHNTEASDEGWQTIVRKKKKVPYAKKYTRNKFSPNQGSNTCDNPSKQTSNSSVGNSSYKETNANENESQGNSTGRTTFSEINIGKKKKKKRKRKAKVCEWKQYLTDEPAYKETVILDSLSICSGMDTSVENANENCDTIVNGEHSYLVKYEKKLSVYRLIHAVSSLLNTGFKPIAYVPHWWYHDVKKCADYLEETPDFHRLIFNELKRDGFLVIGEQTTSGTLTMDQNDVSSCIKLVEDNNAIFCSNNDKLIDYYISAKENPKVSKFISQGNFFILTNFL